MKWQPVEQEKEAAWNALTTTIFYRETLSYEPLECPSCGAKKIHYFFVRHSQDNRGGFWVWCSFCHRYEHSSCRVPDWWIDIENVPYDLLTPYPDWFEENIIMITAQIESINQQPK